MPEFEEIRKKINELEAQSNKINDELDETKLDDLKNPKKLKMYLTSLRLIINLENEISLHLSQIPVLMTNTLHDEYQEFVQIVNNEFANNKEISEETKKKMKKLESEIKKKQKRFTLIENLTIGMNPVKFTGVETGD